jgi:hypothetical protein
LWKQDAHGPDLSQPVFSILAGANQQVFFILLIANVGSEFPGGSWQLLTRLQSQIPSAGID